MGKIRISALVLALVLLTACAQPITAEEAVRIAAGHLQTAYDAVNLRTEEASCEFHEFEELSCYFVDIPYGSSIHDVYRVSVDAATGEVLDVGILK